MIQILEKLIMRHPDDLRLVVFKRGVDFMPEELRLAPAEADQEAKGQGASIQMRILIRKGSVVPACVLNRVVFCAAEVPNLEELEATACARAALFPLPAFFFALPKKYLTNCRLVD